MASPLLLVEQLLSSFTGFSGPTGSTDCGNSTSTTTAGTPNASPTTLPRDITSLIKFLVSFAALRDWFKLIALGSVLESFRRLAFYLYYKTYNSFFITASFEENDFSYDWMMVWLTKQASWTTARDLEVSTRTFGLQFSAINMASEDGSLFEGNQKVKYLPAVHTTQTLWYKRRPMRITRARREVQRMHYDSQTEESLQITIFSRDLNILNSLLVDAKKAYNAANENTISIYVSDQYNDWRHAAHRQKRPLKSIVLDPGIKDLIIEDARDFLGSKSWYAERGIPFRRGYLLYGAPGSGKTSIIHSLASELSLDVYVISLSRIGMDDTTLNQLVSELPEKCIALMEDIDAAFSSVVNRDSGDTQEAENKPGPASGTPTSRVSLSGLLNCLDGVAAQEGRILFATTNKYTSLDPALTRPGRMDIHIEFKLASKYQARELYCCFYLPIDTSDEKTENIQVTEKSSTDSGYASDETNLIDLDVSLPTTTTTTEESASNETDTSVALALLRQRTRAPKLSPAQVSKLADKFKEAIPDREFSMAALQGYLMTHKTRPLEAATNVAAWVEQQRAERSRTSVVKQEKA